MVPDHTLVAVSILDEESVRYADPLVQAPLQFDRIFGVAAGATTSFEKADIWSVSRP